jgi:DinB superfamily
MDAHALLIDLLDEAFDARSWHGTNLRGSLRRLEPRQIVWRASRHRHNVWELVVHAAYWKYAVRRRLAGEPRGSFALEGSNWFERTGAFDRRAWTRDVALLVDEHRRLRAAVAQVSPSALDTRLPKSPFTIAALIRGAAAHDLYHAGQIQLLKRLSAGR